MQTPHLDRLASEGILFRNATCNSPVCMPSRQSFLSGLYPSAIGTACNGIPFPKDIEPIWQTFQNAGYHAANIGKLHFTNHSSRDHTAPHPSYGLDTLVLSDEPGCYDDAYLSWVRDRAPEHLERCRTDTPPAWEGRPVKTGHGREVTEPHAFPAPEELSHTSFVATETIRYLGTRVGEEKPFFCISGFYAPHTPLHPPQRFIDLYDGSKLPIPLSHKNEGTHHLSPAEWRNIRAHYYALVSHVDDQIGRILDALEHFQLRQNTVIVFTSDHGEHLGDHNLIQKGAPGYDSCIRVPLIFTIPHGRIRNLKCDAMAELIDIAPTLAEIAGVVVPDRWQGKSLWPLCRGESVNLREVAFVEYHEPGGVSWKTIRNADWKYMRSATSEERLFFLPDDSGEVQNLAMEKKHLSSLQKMRDLLIRNWFETERQWPRRQGLY